MNTTGSDVASCAAGANLSLLADCAGAAGNTSGAREVPLSGTAIVMVTMYGLICLNGLIGNALVVFVVTRYSKMKTVANLYILNLSITDGVFLLGLPLIMVTAVLRRWVFGSAVCKIYFTLSGINMFSGSFTLVAMSADRFLAVCFPIAALRVRVPVYTRLVLLTTWLLAGAFIVPVVMHARTIVLPGHGGRVSCHMKWPAEQEEAGQLAYHVYTLVAAFVLPVGIIIVLYSLLIARLRAGHGAAVKRKSAGYKHRKVTRLVTLIIAVYIACWLPHWVFQTYLVVQRPLDMPGWMLNMNYVFTLLMYTNSMVNPLLYAFTNEAFRKSFICAFCCAVDPFAGRSLADDTRGARSAGTRLALVPENTDMTTVCGRRTTSKGSPAKQGHPASKDSPANQETEIFAEE